MICVCCFWVRVNSVALSVLVLVVLIAFSGGCVFGYGSKSVVVGLASWEVADVRVLFWV